VTRLVPQSSFWRAALVLLWIAAPIAGIATSSRYVEVCERPPSGAVVCGTQHVGRFLLSRVKNALAEFEPALVGLGTLAILHFSLGDFGPLQAASGTTHAPSSGPM